MLSRHKIAPCFFSVLIVRGEGKQRAIEASRKKLRFARIEENVHDGNSETAELAEVVMTLPAVVQVHLWKEIRKRYN